MLNHNATHAADTLGVEVIDNLKRRILAALEAGDDAHAWALDAVLRDVETILNIAAYPEMVTGHDYSEIPQALGN